MKKKMRIEVVLDIVCPWCFVGKENLYRALEALSDRFTFEVEYLPFQLDPNTPLTGVDRHQYLMEKFGSLSRFTEAEGRVVAMAAEAGIQINFGNIKKQINTFECHRLIHFAHRFGLQKDVVDSLFYHFFTDGMDLSNQGYLLKLGVEAGLPEDELMEFLDSDEGTLEVNEAIGLVYSMGVTAVPFVVINRSLAVSGAQSTESFVAALMEAEGMIGI